MSVSVKREEERLAQELVEGEINSVELSYNTLLSSESHT